MDLSSVTIRSGCLPDRRFGHSPVMRLDHRIEGHPPLGRETGIEDHLALSQLKAHPSKSPFGITKMIRTHVGGLWSKTRATYRRRIRSVSGDMGGESSRRTVATNVGVGIVVALLLVAGPIGGMVAGAPISSMDTGASDGPQGFFEVTIESTNAPVAAGETLTVTAEVVNLFDADDTKEISLTVDGIERDSRELTLHGGERETVTLDRSSCAGCSW